jgi:hypothetical protein
MTRYVWKGGGFVDRETGEPMEKPYPGQITMPYVRGDIPAYRSPVTGELIEGRAARREDLKRHNCREVDPSERPTEGYRSEKFDRKMWNGKKARQAKGYPA